MPSAPWHAAQPFVRYSCAPSLALPFPGGSSSPVGPMEMSSALISSGVGVRPIRYVGPCASAEAPPMSNTGSTNANGRILREPIGHAPVARDVPRLNTVVQPGHAESLIVGFVPVLGDLSACRLDLPQFVGAAREELCLVAVPIPLIAEPGKGHALRRAFELGFVPFLPAVGGHLHQFDGAAAGPRQPADLVEALAGQPLFAGRERDDGLRPDLVLERCDLCLLIEMTEVVVVHVVPIDDLDSP